MQIYGARAFYLYMPQDESELVAVAENEDNPVSVEFMKTCGGGNLVISKQAEYRRDRPAASNGRTRLELFMSFDQALQLSLAILDGLDSELIPEVKLNKRHRPLNNIVSNHENRVKTVEEYRLFCLCALVHAGNMIHLENNNPNYGFAINLDADKPRADYWIDYNSSLQAFVAAADPNPELCTRMMEREVRITLLFGKETSIHKRLRCDYPELPGVNTTITIEMSKSEMTILASALQHLCHKFSKSRASSIAWLKHMHEDPWKQEFLILNDYGYEHNLTCMEDFSAHRRRLLRQLDYVQGNPNRADIREELELCNQAERIAVEFGSFRGYWTELDRKENLSLLGKIAEVIRNHFRS